MFSKAFYNRLGGVIDKLHQLQFGKKCVELTLAVQLTGGGLGPLGKEILERFITGVRAGGEVSMLSLTKNSQNKTWSYYKHNFLLLIITLFSVHWLANA